VREYGEDTGIRKYRKVRLAQGKRDDGTMRGCVAHNPRSRTELGFRRGQKVPRFY